MIIHNCHYDAPNVSVMSYPFKSNPVATWDVASTGVSKCFGEFPTTFITIRWRVRTTDMIDILNSWWFVFDPITICISFCFLLQRTTLFGRPGLRLWLSQHKQGQIKMSKLSQNFILGEGSSHWWSVTDRRPNPSRKSSSLHNDASSKYTSSKICIR